MNVDDEFFVILNNVAFSTKFTGNTPSAFTSLIPSNFVLDGIWEVGLRVLHLPSAPKVEEGKSISSIFVYIDIVNDSISGSVSASYLDLIPMSCMTEKKDYIPPNIAYHRVKKPELSDISIVICDGEGKKLEFDDTATNLPTLVELHFKRRTVV